MNGFLPVTEIQKFCTHDGPGIRTTVFLKGCPLRCKWCHNPETHSAEHEFFYNDLFCVKCGMCVTACPAKAHNFTSAEHLIDRAKCVRCMKCAEICPSGALEKCMTLKTEGEILSEVLKDKAFFGKKGGITVSGGEPMLYARQVFSLLKKAKAAGIGTAVETCGYFDGELLTDIVKTADLFLFDLKDTDELRHQANTGVSLSTIINNLQKIDSLGVRTRLRCIMIRSVNMEQSHYEEIARIFNSLKHCESVELLPYHTFGSSKAVMLGRTDNANVEWIPTNDDMTAAKRFLQKRVKLFK